MLNLKEKCPLELLPRFLYMGDGYESQFYTNLHFDFELNLYGWWVLKKSAFINLFLEKP
jgi:hypothetical protein